MLTTTTTAPAAARVAPSWCGLAELSCLYAPPWMYTIAGSPSVPRSGDQTLSVSQSSDAPDVDEACGAGGPNVDASRAPSHGCTGTGARNRRAPTGGWAYGMPRKTATVPC